ncbi:polysaccharide deacetylase family protein [Streptomyces sp. NBC_01537]|uniref:polysaccharide deacetylase family protein n=1 Tax=Streptomyces sp. NBC_01537 TaxID=2903896 RepID=UPI00386809EC
MALTNSVKGTLAVLAATLAGTAIAGCGAQHGTPSGSAAMVVPDVPRRPSVVPEQHSAPSSSSPRPVRATPTVPKARSASHGPSRKHHTAGRASLGRATTSDMIEHAAEGRGRSVALTFDDGPDPRWTPKVLRLLAQHHAKATFCEIGPNARANPGLVKRITAAGHRLCDHSVHHDEQQSHKSRDYNRHEIVDAQREIAAAAGPRAKLWYYRAPGGDFSPAIRDIAAARGLRPLGWTVDSEDWKRPGVNAILNNINAELRPGAVVLMHDAGGDRSQSVEALRILLDRLDAAGYSYTFPRR